MSPDEQAEYERRLALRERRRHDVVITVERTETPGRRWWWEEDAKVCPTCQGAGYLRGRFPCPRCKANR